MIRTAALALLALWVTLSAWSFDDPADAKVGKLGRPDALVFSGVKAYPESQLRNALAKDFDVLLARDPNARRAEYLKVLERRLSEGYRWQGFPHIKVTAEATADKVQVAISEGDHYFNGGVKVDGPGDVDRELMSMHLTQTGTLPSTGKVVTATTKPMDLKPDFDNALVRVPVAIDFFTDPKERYGEAIKAAFAAQGYYFPEYTAEYKAGEDGNADLWVHIKDTGPRATIGQITLNGLKHHREEEILEFLGVKPGMAVDTRQKVAWEKKLHDSVAFLEGEITVSPAIAPDAPSELSIRIVEQPAGPRLNEKLSAQDEIVQKTANWMQRWGEGDQGDLVVTFQSSFAVSGEIRGLVVISPEAGVAVDCEVLPQGQKSPLHYSLAVTEKELRLVSWHRQRQITADVSEVQFRGWSFFHFSESTDEPGVSTMKIEPKLGFRTGATENPFKFWFEIAPAVAIGHARDRHMKTRIKDGVLEISKEGVIEKVEIETGRLISVEPENSTTRLSDLKQSVIPKTQEDEAFLYFHAGAFDRFLKHLDQETQTFGIAYQPQRPLSSLLEFFLGEVQAIDHFQSHEAALDLGIRLLERDALKPLDHFWAERFPNFQSSTAFALPLSSDDNVKFFGLENQIPFGLGQALGRLVFNLHGLLVPPESGPARVAWSLALMCAGRFREAAINIDEAVASPEVGPLTCWYASRIFGLLNPEWGRNVAAAGLKKLDPLQFRHEMDRLLPSESLLFELAGSVGNAVRQLDDDEFAQLTLLLGKEAQNPAVPRMIETLREQKGTPSRALVLDSLVTLWTLRGRAECEKHLKKLAEPPALEPANINYDDLSIDTLFPGKKSADDKAEDKAEPAKKRESLDDGLTPLTSPRS